MVRVNDFFNQFTPNIEVRSCIWNFIIVLVVFSFFLVIVKLGVKAHFGHFLSLL